MDRKEAAFGGGAKESPRPFACCDQSFVKKNKQPDWHHFESMEKKNTKKKSRRQKSSKYANSVLYHIIYTVYIYIYIYNIYIFKIIRWSSFPILFLQWLGARLSAWPPSAPGRDGGSLTLALTAEAEAEGADDGGWWAVLMGFNGDSIVFNGIYIMGYMMIYPLVMSK